MKILSVIGTRPQYIKIKPFFDFCNEKKINHIIVDTRQHYSKNVSEIFIEEFGLKINYSLDVSDKSEIGFMSSCMLQIRDILNKERPDMVVVYGDTNSTFCAALVSYKMSIPIAHIEAGVRGFYRIPEEVNRVFTDNVSDLRFCSSLVAKENLGNDGIYVGDLEYELLNNIDPNISYNNFGVMTIHRQSNVNKESLNRIFDFCSSIKYNINFYVHHRTDIFIKDNDIKIPKNIKYNEPCSYTDMVKNLSECLFVITDSGSVQKTAPFFGKKTLIMRDEGFEWKLTESEGYAKKCSFSQDDYKWLINYDAIGRDKHFYCKKERLPSEIIFENILKFLGK